jgi:hypothetical protein
MSTSSNVRDGAIIDHSISDFGKKYRILEENTAKCGKKPHKIFRKIFEKSIVDFREGEQVKNRSIGFRARPLDLEQLCS